MAVIVNVSVKPAALYVPPALGVPEIVPWKFVFVGSPLSKVSNTNPVGMSAELYVTSAPPVSIARMLRGVSSTPSS